MDLKSLLNPAQYEAVVTIDQPVLVIAGAGSGKTRVIEYRVWHLINQGIRPEQILLLTFTRKAAREMMARAARHDKRCEQIDGGTYHSFGFKLLKRYARTIGLEPQFSILDTADSNELMGKAYGELGIWDKKGNFPKKETVRGILSKAVNKQLPVKKILEDEYTNLTEFTESIRTIGKLYVRYKQQGNYVDYDDLLVYLKLLLENPTLRTKLADQYQYVMVDEYQDTNLLQGDISYHLASDHGRIMAVGDDAQSIYGFRGANHQNILDFPNRFQTCRIIKLESNYRSTQGVLDVGNAILDNMTKKFAKKLVASKGVLPYAPTTDKPELLFFQNPYAEAAWIVRQMVNLREEGVPFYHQAVLFRSAYISIPLQAELAKEGIPFQVYGGLKFYETAHVKDLVGYLKLLVNPKDELGWRRILLLLEGIGPKTVDSMMSGLATLTDWFQVKEHLLSEFDRFEATLKPLLEMLSVLRAENLNAGDRIQGVLRYYKPLLKRHHDDWQERLSDLETLVTIAANYPSLESFLAEIALEPPERGAGYAQAEADLEERPVTLSTIHSAKGLEWEAVYVIGVADGVLPSRLSLKSPDQIEEEQRLLYVAVTRAKRKLYLTMHHQGQAGGLYQFNRLSRFIETPNILKTLKQEMKESEEIAPRYGDLKETVARIAEWF